MSRDRDTVKLLYFQGCPNVDAIRSLLRKANVAFIEIRQEALPVNHPLGKYTSPTVLSGKRVILGSEGNNGNQACSLDLPPLDELLKRLDS